MNLTISTGIEMVRVPNAKQLNAQDNVSDGHQARVRSLFQRAGLGARFIITYYESAPVGGWPVSRQSPAAGTLVRRGSTVTVWYAGFE